MTQANSIFDWFPISSLVDDHFLLRNEKHLANSNLALFALLKFQRKQENLKKQGLHGSCAKLVSTSIAKSNGLTTDSSKFSHLIPFTIFCAHLHLYGDKNSHPQAFCPHTLDPRYNFENFHETE